MPWPHKRHASNNSALSAGPAEAPNTAQSNQLVKLDGRPHAPLVVSIPQLALAPLDPLYCPGLAF